ncbi:MAG: ATP-binding protein [Gemmatimonadota bacterium]|nr:ATP-binding protein [Gemmatimonadota bacterium]
MKACPPASTGLVSVETDPTTLIGALAEIAVRLTDARPTELVAQDVVERAHLAVGGTELAIWLSSDGKLARTWAAGSDETTVEEIPGARQGGGGVIVRDMSFGPRRVGVVLVRLENESSEPVERFVEAIAALMAAFVANSERSRRLESDIQIRMREVEEQKRFTETVLDLLPLGLYVIDRDYRITVWNRKRETGMQGVSREEAIGRTLFEILHRQPEHIVRPEFDEVFRTGKTQQFQTESSTSGVLRTYRLSKIPIRDDRGTVTHIITIGEDITDWVEAREAVAQNEKLAAIGRLAAGIMHEINNPLATISACAETMALETTSVEGEPEYLKIIGSEVQRCKRIIDGLLDFSRPRAQERTSLQVNTVVERALFLLKHHARFKQLTVRAELGANLSNVHASAEQLIQVLIALLMNAADAMPQYGRVLVRTRAAPLGAGSVVIEVQDEGSGMTRNEMARIFEPFYTTKEPGRGTGLGLAICHGIVADHGGRIEVSSEPGAGTRFTILLPVEEL